MAVGIDDFNWDMDDVQPTDTPPKGDDVEVEKGKDADATVPDDEDKFDFEDLPVKEDEGDDIITPLSGDSQLLKTLKEKEIFTIDFTDDDDLETAFNRQLEQDVDDAITVLFEGIKKQPEAVALIKHLKDGGSVSTFMANSSYAIDVDIDTEEQQIALIKDYYVKRKNMEADEVTDLVDTLKNNGKLESRAENIKQLVEREREAEQLAAVENKKKHEQQLIANHKQLTSSLTGIVRDVKFDFKGVGKDKDDTVLVDYLTKPTDANGKTGFQKAVSELFVEKNHEKLLILAKLLKTDFNFDKLIKKGATQQVRTIKDKVENRTVNVKTGNAGRSKSLADFFE